MKKIILTLHIILVIVPYIIWGYMHWELTNINDDHATIIEQLDVITDITKDINDTLNNGFEAEIID